MTPRTRSVISESRAADRTTTCSSGSDCCARRRCTPVLAAILVGLAWGVPLVLSAIAGHAIGPAATRPFLLDLGAWARFFIAIGIFVLMERLVEERLRAHLRQFVRAPLIAPGSQPGAAEAVVRALRRRDAWLPELACVVLAYAITLAGVSLVLDAEASSWLVTVGSEGVRSTPAGWWCALVSSHLFWFLLLRWLWRHAVRAEAVCRGAQKAARRR